MSIKTKYTDKNDNPIYQGDVFHLGDPKIKYIVEWHERNSIPAGHYGRQITNQSLVGLDHWKENIEVIESSINQ
jgi:hypothetical protein